MTPLGDFIDRIEAVRKTLDVYTDDDALVAALRSQFSTRNVAVRHRAHSTLDADDFVVVRDPDGAFLAAIGTDRLQQLLSPEIRPPWEPVGTDVDLADVLDFLDETPFTSFRRRQLLAITREFEERAWRVGTGTVYVGFQRRAALRAQTPVYNRFARETELAIELFLGDDPPADIDDSIGVNTAEDGEIGQYWFLAFDGGDRGDPFECGLVASERDPGQYYGFWTADPSFVDEICTSLRTRYGV